MKTIIWISSLFILLVLALVAANFISGIEPAQGSTQAALFVQITPTLIPDGLSEIGSTNGILIMGVVIVLIVMVPVIFRKKRN